MIGQVRSIGTSLVILLAFLVIGLGLTAELRRKTVIIDAIEVPEGLAKQGLSKEGMSLRLRDAIATAAVKANSDRENLPFALSPVDLTVPGTTTTLGTVVEFVASAFGIKISRINGNLTTADQGASVYRLTLRSSARRPEVYFDRTGLMEALIADASLETLKEFDPYTAASYLVSNGGDHADTSLDFIYRYYARAFAEELKTSGFSHEDSEVPWAYLIWGYALQGRGEWSAAVEKFRQAANAHEMRHPADKPWRLAIDGLALSLKQDGRPNEAARILDNLLTVDGDYVSALYNRAKIAQEFESDWCKAKSFFARANRINGRYGLAWEGIGIVYLDQLKRLRAARLDPSAGVAPHMCLSSDEPQVERDAENAFTQAVGNDPLHGPSWYQFGAFLFEIDRLEAAASKFEQAAILIPEDAHVWQSVGQSYLDLSSKGKAGAALKAATAFCRAMILRPNEPWHLEGLDRALSAARTGQDALVFCSAIARRLDRSSSTKPASSSP